MSLLLECAVAALEREQLVVVDASEPLPGCALVPIFTRLSYRR